MTQLFISHSHDDRTCADRIRNDLETAGYTAWKDTQSIPPGSPSYVRAIENGIRASAATLVIWSRAAAESEWVERELLFSQQLQKPIFPVFIDDTEPGILLVAAQYVKSRQPYSEAVPQLLPHLPPVTDDDYQEVAALLVHEHIRERKQGIERARELIEAGRYQEQLLALLEDLARKDLITTVQEAARAVIAATGESAAQADESRHIFGVRCPNGHITYFDRRRICPDEMRFYRSMRASGGTTVSDFSLECGTCGEPIVVPVDCEGYQ